MKEKFKKFAKDLKTADANGKLMIFMEYTDGVLSYDQQKALIDMGFNTAPSSKGHHGAVMGGLLMHSIMVAAVLEYLTEANGLKWEKRSSPMIIGIMHDLCKVDSYIRTMETEEVEFHSGKKAEIMTGQHWEWNENQDIIGHGDKSVILAQQIMSLNQEEIMCIRYHMGPYMPGDKEAYTRAIKKNENVLWVQTADMYASQILDM